MVSRISSVKLTDEITVYQKILTKINIKMEQPQDKPKAKMLHFINWYFVNFCVKHEECTRGHYEEMERIGLSLDIPEMTHK